MSTEIWISIILALISNSISVWSKLYKRKKKNLKKEPNQKAVVAKSNIVLWLSAVFSLSISVYNILTFITDPVLSNVFSLCIGISIFFFTITILIFNLLFDKLINLLKDHIELTTQLTKDSVKSMKHFGKTLTIVENLSKEVAEIKENKKT